MKTVSLNRVARHAEARFAPYGVKVRVASYDFGYQLGIAIKLDELFRHAVSLPGCPQVEEVVDACDRLEHWLKAKLKTYERSAPDL